VRRKPDIYALACRAWKRAFGYSVHQSKQDRAGWLSGWMMGYRSGRRSRRL
jgi:hypothetical protein